MSILLMPQFISVRRNPQIDVTSAAGEWTGKTSDATLTSPNIIKINPTAIRNVTQLSGDFIWTGTMASGNTTARIAVFAASEVGTFDENDADGGLKSMTNSFLCDFGTGAYYVGSSTDGGSPFSDIANGSVVQIKRLGSTITVVDDSVTDKTFGTTYGGDMFLMLGNVVTFNSVSWSYNIP